MKIMLIIYLALLAPFIFAADDSLLKISQKSTCIRNVVSVFVGNRNCSILDDFSKSKLALKMTECLLLQMGKKLPVECINKSSSDCQLEGDAWNTFSTFFAHVDNLCHFYWQMLHHEKAEQLIGKLSESSSNAQKILKENVQQTRKILTLQHQMHSAIDQSLQNQQKMQKLILRSTQHISNLTNQIQTFVGKIRQDIDSNYASLRNILVVINQGLSQLLSVQVYMMAQITSIRGMVYFICQFFIIMFITSFPKYSTLRNKCLSVMLINIGIEFLFDNIIESCLGIKNLRYLFIIAQCFIVGMDDRKHCQLEAIITNHFNTPRLERVFKKVINQNDFLKVERIMISSLPDNQRHSQALNRLNVQTQAKEGEKKQ